MKTESNIFKTTHIDYCATN